MKTNRITAVWNTYSAAPHRVMFLGGALQAVFPLLWWLPELARRYGFIGDGGSAAAPWTHAFLLIYGFFPFFIFGFLFTTYPAWLNGPKVPRAWYVSAFLPLAAGVALFYGGLAVGKPLLLAGVALMLAGWGVALTALLRVFFAVAHPDKRHPAATSIALALGWLGMAAYGAGLATDSPALLNASWVAGIWLFLLPVFLVVSHRMIPFFSSCVLENYVMVRPYWLLWAMLAAAFGHGVLALAGEGSYLWLCDLPLAAAALYLSYAWGFWRSFRVRLLAVLHVSFLWLGAALVLYSLQGLLRLPLGLAPLHALTIGYFSAMVIAMASRVTLGHSGRPLVADDVTWRLFLGFQAAAAVRVAADVPPLAGPASPYLYLASAAIWLVCFIPWAVKYGPMYWRPRVDGKSG